MRRVSFMGRRPQDGYELSRLMAHWQGVPMATIEAAREGRNGRCVECGRAPLDGGLRCVRCFGRVAKRGAA